MRFDAIELKRLREGRGLTQRQLAAAVGVNAATICKLERGNRDPLAVTCGRLAQVLGVSIGQLVHD